MNSIAMDTTKELFSWFEAYSTYPNKLPIFIGDKNNKVFCSGADLKYFYSIRNNLEEYYKYFNIHYYLFDKMHEHSNKNFIFIWNGVTMGGGVGLSINGKFRIATESTVFSMPEAKFGFYTNCNYADFIRKFVNVQQALYMSLFAHSYKGYEVYEKSFATNFVLNKYLRNLIVDIKSINYVFEKEDEIKKIIEHYQKISLKEIDFMKIKEEIKYFDDELDNKIFNFNIKTEFINFNENIKKSLEKNYPSLLREYNSRSILTNKLNYEIALSSYDNELRYEDRFNKDVDFNEISVNVGNMFEGARAFFVDKDNNPKWKVNSVEELKL
jgi:enoyl-CoA hydratase/carnithine racemase